MQIFRNMDEPQSGNIRMIPGIHELTEDQLMTVKETYNKVYLANARLGIRVAQGMAYEAAKTQATAPVRKPEQMHLPLVAKDWSKKTTTEPSKINYTRHGRSEGPKTPAEVWLHRVNDRKSGEENPMAEEEKNHICACGHIFKHHNAAGCATCRKEGLVKPEQVNHKFRLNGTNEDIIDPLVSLSSEFIKKV